MGNFGEDVTLSAGGCSAAGSYYTDDINLSDTDRAHDTESFIRHEGRTWYQDKLHELENELCPPGVHAEFRDLGLIETKVNMMESGKWEDFVANQSRKGFVEKLRGSRDQSSQAFTRYDDGDVDCIYQTRPTYTRSRPGRFRPHINLSHANQPKPLQQPTRCQENTQPCKHPGYNNRVAGPTTTCPKEIFSTPSPPIFGTIKCLKEGSNTHRSPNIRPSTASGPRSNSARCIRPAERPSSASSTMRGSFLTQRHMGIPISTAPKHTSHARSGYERYLKGTLLHNHWRDEDLMTGNGKICFHPLSFDVLETLSFGPANKDYDKIGSNKPMPSERRSLVAKIYLCLQNQSKNTQVVVQDILKFYDAAKHPAVTSGRVSANELLLSLLADLLNLNDKSECVFYNSCADSFPAHILEAEVSEDDVIRHYSCVSAATNSDEYFKKLLFSTWHKVWPLKESMCNGYVKRIDTVPFERIMNSQHVPSYDWGVKKTTRIIV
mmetsp:Transcript_24777/g.36547  ORF Transcript_24777/g.36547 Transcript_24777/m.36547 type:complete len:493 (+) Transcript_24777:77-1555(+)